MKKSENKPKIDARPPRGEVRPMADPPRPASDPEPAPPVAVAPIPDPLPEPVPVADPSAAFPEPPPPGILDASASLLGGEPHPNPVELPTPINPEGARKQSVETHRNLFCQHYDECLDEAVKRGWNSFTCVRCTFYRTTAPGGDSGVERFATQRRVS